MIDRSERHRWFSRRLIEAMGLGSLVGLPLAGIACGSSVVTSAPNSNSGSGTTSNTSGAGGGIINDGVSTATGTTTGSTSVSQTSVVGAGGAGGQIWVDVAVGVGGQLAVTNAVGVGGYGATNAVGVGGFSVTIAVGVGGYGTGAGGQTSVSGSGGAGGGFACNPPVPAGYSIEEGCFAAPAQGCPAVGSVEAASSLATVLGLCNSTVSIYQCCGVPAIAAVECELPQRGTSCCYDALVNMSPVCGPITGRPFTASGQARTAPAHERSDWSAASSPAMAALDPYTQRALAEAWTRDARFEHASVASFARLALELLAVGAPADLVRDAQRAMGDEIRHAELCFALAGTYAGTPVGPGPLALEGALGRASLAEMAAAAVREGCVGETVAALGAAEARDVATDPAARAALDAIAADEAEHAAMSWRLVAWAFRSGGAEVRSAIAAAFAEPMDLGAEPAPHGVDAAAFHAHGRLLPDEVRAHAARALAEVVRPSAAALLSSFLEA